MKRTLNLGKVDYNGSGRKNCMADLEIELRDTDKGPELSVCANIWNPRRTDIYIGGQCVEEVAAYFPHNTTAQWVVALWKRYHLNGMKAGSATQETYLREHPIDPKDYAYPKSYYEVASKTLADAGMNPDADGYKYGSAWKYEAIPTDVLAEIKAICQAGGDTVSGSSDSRHDCGRQLR